ncbi:hypothetical protein PENCOP_c013G04850 [Penicillium coprophilum]|uniref:Nephrocystin 3-like N-terminal domain-containing protein n=1 Tax=Penicillium coprophilum TaxID=36646 RepID=A0A1V6UA50_9EURO|nr:hypothetical protein PENCOP_c013G04850 [Penicillium coprophilum]
MANGMPEFLTGSTREEEPKREKYADETPEEAQAVGPAIEPDLDNEGKSEMYWVHLMEYETTQLRDLYTRPDEKRKISSITSLSVLCRVSRNLSQVNTTAILRENLLKISISPSSDGSIPPSSLTSTSATEPSQNHTLRSQTSKNWLQQGPKIIALRNDNLWSEAHDIYVAILYFLARDARTSQHSSFRRAPNAMWSSGDIEGFKRQCREFEARAEVEAQVFERCQSNNARTLLNELLDMKHQTDAIGQVEVAASATWEYLRGKEKHDILYWVSEIDAEDQPQITMEDRTDGTGNWLLNHHEFQHWRSLNEAAILWLHGIPGAGKTKLVSKVVDHFEEDYPDATLAYFCCDREDEKLRNPVNILRSYIKQLAGSQQTDAIRRSVVERFQWVVLLIRTLPQITEDIPD